MVDFSHKMPLLEKMLDKNTRQLKEMDTLTSLVSSWRPLIYVLAFMGSYGCLFVVEVLLGIVI
jgi:hypothetical protein